MSRTVVLRVNVSSTSGSERTLSLTGSMSVNAPGEKSSMNLTPDDEWEIKCLLSGKAECHCLILLGKVARALTRHRIKNQSLKDWIKVLEHELARVKNAGRK